MHLWRQCAEGHGGGGAPGPGPLHRPPPPPQKLAPKCRTIGAKSAESKFCLMWQRVKNCFFTLCVNTQYTRNCQEKSIMGKNGYFFSVRPKLVSHLCAEFLRDGHYPSWWDTVLTNKGSLVQFPVVAKVQYSGTRVVKAWVVKVFSPFFPPIAHQESTMQRQVTCSQF